MATRPPDARDIAALRLIHDHRMYAHRVTRAKSGYQLADSSLTLLVPECDSRERRLLAAIISRIGIDPDDCNWVETWEQAILGGCLNVVSCGKMGVEAWHRWGQVKVTHAHGDLFRRDWWNILVVEHPGGGFQRTAWGYGVKEHLRDEITAFWLAITQPEFYDMDDMLGRWCVKCRGGRDARMVPVHAYFHEADWVPLCERHWRGRAGIVHVPKPRPKKGSREAQMEGQMELVVSASIQGEET